MPPENPMRNVEYGIQNDKMPVFHSSVFLRHSSLGRTAVLVWAIILGFVCVRAAVQPYKRTLFTTWEQAGADWEVGRDLYRNSWSPDQDQFRYSPLTAVLLVPFHHLPIRLGGVVGVCSMRGVLLGGFALVAAGSSWSADAAPAGHSVSAAGAAVAEQFEQWPTQPAGHRPVAGRAGRRRTRTLVAGGGVRRPGHGREGVSAGDRFVAGGRRIRAALRRGCCSPWRWRPCCLSLASTGTTSTHSTPCGCNGWARTSAGIGRCTWLTAICGCSSACIMCR